MAIYSRNDILYVEFSCFTPTGKRIRCRESTGLKDTKKNRELVNSKFKAIQYEVKHGRFDYLHFFPDGAKAHLFRASVSDIPFTQCWADWLIVKSLRPNTAKNWKSAYDVHIEPYFGHKMLSEIDEHQVLVFRKLLVDKGLKASSINAKIMKPLGMALGYAHKRGLIPVNPCASIRKLTEEIVEINPFTFDELRHFLRVLKKKRPEYHEMMVIWWQTGLRVGEICALEWEHIDAENKKLKIRQTMHSNGTIGPPKTPNSVRDVDLPMTALVAFDKLKKRSKVLHSRFIFTTGAHKPFTDQFLRKKFYFLLKLADLQQRSPKQMRHTFATLHIASGENISWVSKMLGHANVEITLKRYNRFLPNLTHQDGSACQKIWDEKTKFDDF